ncbi:hypothetical protein D3C76_1591990 [compost metagenome]
MLLFSETDFIAKHQGDFHDMHLKQNRTCRADTGAVPQGRDQPRLGRALADRGATLPRDGRRRPDRTVLGQLLRRLEGPEGQ